MAEYRLLLCLQLADIETAYWREIDHNLGRDAPSFYTEDGVFTISGRSMHGREAVAAFYKWRRERGQRTARHVVSNFHLVSYTERQAVLEVVMCLYAADGPPVLTSAPPIVVADIKTHFVRDGADSPWLMSSHELSSVFEGGVPATIPPDVE